MPSTTELQKTKLATETSNQKVMRSTPITRTRIFSSEPPVSLTETSSFSCIHQAQNSPSHLYHGTGLTKREKPANTPRNNHNLLITTNQPLPVPAEKPSSIRLF